MSRPFDHLPMSLIPHFEIGFDGYKNTLYGSRYHLVLRLHNDIWSLNTCNQRPTTQIYQHLTTFFPFPVDLLRKDFYG